MISDYKYEGTFAYFGDITLCDKRREKSMTRI